MTDSSNAPDFSAADLASFLGLREAAVAEVSDRFFLEFARHYDPPDERVRRACREDIAFNIDFLRPALEFGLLTPFVDYLRWLQEILASRGLPLGHVDLSLRWLDEFYCARLPAAAGEHVSRTLREARAALSERGDPLAGLHSRMPEAWPDSEALTAALLDGDRRRARVLLGSHLDRGRTLLEVEFHLVQPALYRIGREWQANRISVADEHLATATATALIAELSISTEPPPPVGRKCMVACVEGNDHALGPRIVADAFEQAGWEVRYLGGNVPNPSLVSAAASWRPDLLGLSASMPTHLPAVREAAGALHELPGGGPALMLGGVAINTLPGLAAAAGVRHVALDARQALQAAEKILEERD